MLELPTQEPRSGRRWGWMVGMAMIVALLGIGMVAVAFWGFGQLSYESPSLVPPSPRILDSVGTGVPSFERTPSQLTPTAAEVVVYISGEVQHPDVYRMPVDARVKDVVVSAGGFTENAAYDQINLAARIFDEQQIYVPHVDDMSASYREGMTGSGSATAPESRRININRASAAELESLPGVGPALAQRIIDYRTSNGPFLSVQDVQKVGGIGPALFETLSSLITVTE